MGGRLLDDGIAKHFIFDHGFIRHLPIPVDRNAEPARGVSDSSSGGGALHTYPSPGLETSGEILKGLR